MNDLPAALVEALRGRYRLERELGRGGMATVYLAQDLKHDRPVALKVLHQELSASLGAERFQREVRLAARLQHPHVLTVHDSGETAGALWFTMPFVEGESLRDRLNRERQLPVDEALRITREAAQALQYAHDHGVIHRDIKPENILLTRDGSTLVADFGIARAIAGGERLTVTGMSIGTPAYMSPEQASGDSALDARTDVYSLGCVLYEMLAGEPPFTGATAQAMIARRFSETAPSLRLARPSVPEAVDQAVQRTLAPIPADRFATVGELARALQLPMATAQVTPVSTPAGRRRLPTGVLLLLLGFAIGAGVLFAWRSRRGANLDGAGPKRIAVLPFENMGDSADAYFADGITDEVRGKLSQLPGLAVIARSSSNEYRHSAKSPQEIARDLNAEYLLTATVRWEKPASGPSRVRVSPELVQVEPGAAPTTRWQQPFEASLTDVFQVQADIAGRVAGALNVALGDSARAELAAKPTANLAAYDAYLKGEAALQGMAANDPASLRRAIASYEQAVRLDPGFVPAWAQLARARSVLYLNSTPTPELAAEARAAAERARSLGPNRPETALALGDVSSARFDYSQALAAYTAGLKIAPNNVDLLTAAGLAEQSLGRSDASLRHLSRAAELDPRSAVTARRIALALLWSRRYPEAVAAASRAVALTPGNPSVIELRAMVDLAQGNLAGARSVLRTGLGNTEPDALLAYFGIYWDLYWVLDDSQQRRLLTFSPAAWDGDRATRAIIFAQLYRLRGDSAKTRLYADSARQLFNEQLRAAPDDPQRHSFRGLALAYLGRKAEAVADGERGLALNPVSNDAIGGAYCQHQLARIYLAVGEPDKALDQLEALLRMRYYLSPGWLRIDPTFASLRGNPRFEKLLE